MIFQSIPISFFHFLYLASHSIFQFSRFKSIYYKKYCLCFLYYRHGRIYSNCFPFSFSLVFHFLFTEHHMLQDVIKLTKVKREKVRRNKDQLFVNGYRFVIASQSESTIYLKCANFRNKCNARASRRKDTNETFISKSQHTSSCVYHAETEPNLVPVDAKYDETVPPTETVYYEEKHITQ